MIICNDSSDYSTKLPPKLEDRLTSEDNYDDLKLTLKTIKKQLFPLSCGHIMLRQEISQMIGRALSKGLGLLDLRCDECSNKLSMKELGDFCEESDMKILRRASELQAKLYSCPECKAPYDNTHTRLQLPDFDDLQCEKCYSQSRCKFCLQEYHAGCCDDILRKGSVRCPTCRLLNSSEGRPEDEMMCCCFCETLFRPCCGGKQSGTGECGHAKGCRLAPEEDLWGSKAGAGK